MREIRFWANQGCQKYLTLFWTMCFPSFFKSKGSSQWIFQGLVKLINTSRGECWYGSFFFMSANLTDHSFGILWNIVFKIDYYAPLKIYYFSFKLNYCKSSQYCLIISNVEWFGSLAINSEFVLSSCRNRYSHIKSFV